MLVAGDPGGPPDGAREAAVADPRAGLWAAVADACAALGASVSTCWPISDLPGASDEAALGAVVAGVVGEAGKIDLLAVDGAGLFAHGLARGGDGHAALRACMDAAWNATRAVVNGAFLRAARAGEVQAAGGRAAQIVGEGELRSPAARRIVYLAPTPDAGDHAKAACAGLENLARTLSIEWARHGITTVAIAPGAGTPADETAALAAYLASAAGAYFSGCLLDLRGP